MTLSLKIHISRVGKTDPETKITLPLSTFEYGKKLIPKRTLEFLQREGIDLAEITQGLNERHPKGRLIDIENTTYKVSLFLE